MKKDHKTKIVILIGILVLILATLEGITLLSTQDTKFTSLISHSSKSTGQRITYFLLDGLDYDVFQEELEKGNLPELKKMIEEGIYFPKVVAAFPSMTGYGFWPLITGYDSTQSGIMGLRWWDRNRTEGNLRNYVGPTNKNMNLDINEYPKTIFERVTEYSSTLQSYMNRGVTSNIQLKWTMVVTKYSRLFPLGPLRLVQHIPLVGRYLLPDELLCEEETVDNAMEDLEKYNPRVQWITFGTPDGYRHIFGEDREDYYREIIRNCDKQIARYRAKCRELGGEELHRLFVVTSDHGIVNLQQHINLERVLGQINVNMYYGPSASVLSSDLNTPLKDLDAYDGAVAVNGNTLVHLYFRSDVDRNSPDNNWGWKDAKDCHALRNYQKEGQTNSVDIIDMLVAAEGVELVICLQQFQPFLTPRREVHIYSKDGHSLIYEETPGGRLTYEVEDEADPFGWYPPSSSHSYTPDEWLDNTGDWEFPYATVRVWRAMIAPSAGDLIVTSLPLWDLAKEGYEVIVGENRGGHGGLRKDQLIVPAIVSSLSNRQSLKSGHVIPHSRSEDIGATMLKLVGVFDEELLLRNSSLSSPLLYAHSTAIQGKLLPITRP